LWVRWSQPRSPTCGLCAAPIARARAVILTTLQERVQLIVPRTVANVVECGHRLGRPSGLRSVKLRRRAQSAFVQSDLVRFVRGREALSNGTVWGCLVRESVSAIGPHFWIRNTVPQPFGGLQVRSPPRGVVPYRTPALSRSRGAFTPPPCALVNVCNTSNTRDCKSNR
jgi:hypothetical protein